eukprot:9499469-Pyramimonas_sp.AAC.2
MAARRLRGEDVDTERVAAERESAEQQAEEAATAAAVRHAKAEAARVVVAQRVAQREAEAARKLAEATTARQSRAPAAAPPVDRPMVNLAVTAQPTPRAAQPTPRAAPVAAVVAERSARMLAEAAVTLAWSPLVYSEAEAEGGAPEAAVMLAVGIRVHQHQSIYPCPPTSTHMSPPWCTHCR